MNNAINPADEIQIGGSSPVEFSPLTEFLNGSTDQVFVSGLTAASPNFIEYNINDFHQLVPEQFPAFGDLWRDQQPRRVERVEWLWTIPAARRKPPASISAI